MEYSRGVLAALMVGCVMSGRRRRRIRRGLGSKSTSAAIIKPSGSMSSAYATSSRGLHNVSAVCPGSVSDLVSYEETGLSKRVEKLPVGVLLLGDSAYMLSEHLLTPFPGKDLPSDRHAFNFYRSQLRIRVEIAFGLLVSKWRIFWAPIEASIEHTTQRMLAAQNWHNVCITERLQRNKDDHVNASEIEPLHFQGTTAAYLPSDSIVRVGTSLLRDIMMRRIADSNAVRPTYNLQRREREDNQNA